MALNTGKKMGAPSGVEKVRREEQNIEEQARRDVAQYIKKNGEEWLDLLPPAQRATIIAQFIPKARASDDELADELHDMQGVLGALPKLDDITAELRACRVALCKVNNELIISKHLYKEMEQRDRRQTRMADKSAWFQGLRESLFWMKERYENVLAEKATANVTTEQIDQAIARALGKEEGKKPAYVESN